MILAITSNGKELSSSVDSRFGRANCFIIYNTDDSKFKVLDNNQNLSASQGAGIQTAQNVVDAGADVVITGNCGPKAFRVLESANIKIYGVTEGSVENAINLFTNDKLTELTNPNVQGHWS